MPIPFLARFEEVLAPAIVEVGGNAFAAAQLGDALLTPQPFENDPDLFLRSELPASTATDLPYCRFCRLLLRSCHFETLPGISDPVKCLLA